MIADAVEAAKQQSIDEMVHELAITRQRAHFARMHLWQAMHAAEVSGFQLTADLEQSFAALSEDINTNIEDC